MTPGFESITEKVEQDRRPQERAGERLDNALHKTESLHAQAAPERAPRLVSQQGNAREDHRVTLSRAHFKVQTRCCTFEHQECCHPVGPLVTIRVCSVRSGAVAARCGGPPGMCPTATRTEGLGFLFHCHGT